MINTLKEYLYIRCVSIEDRISLSLWPYQSISTGYGCMQHGWDSKDVEYAWEGSVGDTSGQTAPLVS